MSARRPVHPIEVESYRILRSRIDLSGWPPLSRAVVERMIHASADLDYAHTTRLDEEAARAGVAALARGAPVVVDAAMVRAGITGRATYCALDEAPADHVTTTPPARAVPPRTPPALTTLRPASPARPGPSGGRRCATPKAPSSSSPPRPRPSTSWSA